MIAQKGKASIPYTAIITYTDGTTDKIPGTWTGVAYYNDEVTITVIKSNTCSRLSLALAEEALAEITMDATDGKSTTSAVESDFKLYALLGAIFVGSCAAAY